MSDYNYTNLSTLRVTVSFSWSGMTVSNKPFCHINTNLYTSDDDPIYGTPFYEYSITSSSGSASVDLDVPLSLNGVGYGYLLDNTAYKLVVVVSIYDSAKTLISRAYETEYHEFTFWRYDIPIIPIFSATRCLSDGTVDESGEYVIVSTSYEISSLGGSNTKSLFAYIKERTSEVWTLDTTFDMSSIGYSDTISDYVLSNTFSGSVSYDLKIVAIDVLNTSSNIKSITVTETTFEVDAVNRKVSVGKRIESDSPQFDVNEDGRFGGDLDVGGIVNYSLNGRRIALSESDFLSSTSYSPFSGEAVNGGSLMFGYGYSNHPGAVTLWSGSSTPSGYSISTDDHSIQLGGGEIVHAIFKQSQISTTSYIGFYDSFLVSSSSLIEGVHIKLSGAKAYGVTSRYDGSATSSLTSASTYTLTEGTWYHAIVKLEEIGSVMTALFSLQSESGEVLWSDSLNTNIPILSSTRVCAGVFSTSSYLTDSGLTVLDYLSLSILRDLIR